MYTAGLPKTKLLSPSPAARFDGKLHVDGREITVDNWAGWWATTGARSTRSAGSGSTAPLRRRLDATCSDAAIGRVKLGPVTTPWVGNGALSLDGRRHA